MALLGTLGVFAVIGIIAWIDTVACNRKEQWADRLKLLRLTYPDVAFYGEGNYYVHTRVGAQHHIHFVRGLREQRETANALQASRHTLVVGGLYTGTDAFTGYAKTPETPLDKVQWNR